AAVVLLLCGETAWCGGVGRDRGQNPIPTDEWYQPLFGVFGCAVFGERAGGRGDATGVGYRCHGAAEFLQHRALLQQAGTASADRGGQAGVEHPRLGQFCPECAVETIVVRFRGVCGRRGGRAGQRCEVLLCLGVCDGDRVSADVYRRTGWPSAVAAMMSRCTSLVPPPKVRINDERWSRSIRPWSSAPGEPSRTTAPAPRISMSSRYPSVANSVPNTFVADASAGESSPS